MELFTQSWSLSQRLRVPAISRLQKVHNVDIALQALRDRGVDLKDEHGKYGLVSLGGCLAFTIRASFNFDLHHFYLSIFFFFLRLCFLFVKM